MQGLGNYSQYVWTEPKQRSGSLIKSRLLTNWPFSSCLSSPAVSNNQQQWNKMVDTGQEEKERGRRYVCIPVGRGSNSLVSVFWYHLLLSPFRHWFPPSPPPHHRLKRKLRRRPYETDLFRHYDLMSCHTAPGFYRKWYLDSIYQYI